LLRAGIVDHKKDQSAVEEEDMYIKYGSNMQPRKTTKGWSLCIEWNDGSTSRECLANLKESNPMEVADYALVHGLEAEPAFAWWVPFTFRVGTEKLLPLTSDTIKNTQFWYRDTEDIRRLCLNRQRKRQHTLTGCHMQGNVEGENCVQNVG
jgi:hypothetical protein